MPKSQLLPIRKWHTTEKNLLPYQTMVRELYLMSIIIRRDWTSDDTTNEQDHELDKISKQIKLAAKRLTHVFEDSANKGRKTVVQPRKKARKKENTKTH
jgi:hypothetical protein